MHLVIPTQGFGMALSESLGCVDGIFVLFYELSHLCSYNQYSRMLAVYQLRQTPLVRDEYPTGQE